MRCVLAIPGHGLTVEAHEFCKTASCQQGWGRECIDYTSAHCVLGCGVAALGGPMSLTSCPPGCCPGSHIVASTQWSFRPMPQPLLPLLLLRLQKSIKCYSYLEGVELEAPGSAVLELYKKPVDIKRKGRPTLLTTKPMYLHISRRLAQH